MLDRLNQTGAGLTLFIIPIVGWIWWIKLFIKSGNYESNRHGQPPQRRINMDAIFSFSLSKLNATIGLTILLMPMIMFFAIKGYVPLEIDESMILPSRLLPTPSPAPTVIPKPTMENPSSWSTFVSEKGKYLLKYPATQKLQENQKLLSGFKTEWPGAIMLSPINLAIDFKELSPKQTLEEYLSKHSGCADTLPAKAKSTVLDDRQGLIFENIQCGSPVTTEVYVINNDILYTMQIENYNDEAKGILSTFKFIN